MRIFKKLSAKSKNQDLKDRINIYVTFNGMPVYSLTNINEPDEDFFFPSFLHAIDSFTMESRKVFGRSTNFYGFAFPDKIEVSIKESSYIDNEGIRNEGRLFLKTAFGKIPHNRDIPSIIALMSATHDTIKKLTKKELNLTLNSQDTVDYFIDRLKNSGYTPDKVITELERLKVSQSRFSGYIPISLFIVKEKKGILNEIKEIGNYHEGKFKFNPVKDDEEHFRFELNYLINIAGALKLYQERVKLEKTPILLRFQDYMLEVSYKKNKQPIIGVLVKGKMIPEQLSKYRRDIRDLESE